MDQLRDILVILFFCQDVLQLIPLIMAGKDSQRCHQLEIETEVSLGVIILQISDAE